MSQMIDPNQKSYVHPVTGYLHVESHNNEPTKTQQQYQEDCDINNIMAKHVNPIAFMNSIQTTGQYGEFSQITDYQEMLETVRYADAAFMGLPAELRARFKNDPGQLLTFLQDPNNRAEGEKLGLINKKPPPQTIEELNAINKQTQTSTNANPPPSPKSKKTTTIIEES